MPRPMPPRCDAHVHLWDPGASSYDWLRGAPAALRRAFAPGEVLPELADRGFRRLVLVQADDTRADSVHLQRLAAEIPRLAPGVAQVGVVAWLPLARPADVAALLADDAAMRHVVGVRHLTHDDADPFFLRRPDVGESLRLLAGAGLPLDVPDAFPAQMSYLPQLAEDHPDLQIVLDHLGKPPIGGHDGAWRTWREMLARLSGRENVVAKASGLGTSGTGDRAGIVAALEEARAQFGASRLLYGSDWPIAPRAGDYASGTDATLAHLRSWPAAEQHAVLAGTAHRVYRWDS